MATRGRTGLLLALGIIRVGGRVVNESGYSGVCCVDVCVGVDV